MRYAVHFGLYPEDAWNGPDPEFDGVRVGDAHHRVSRPIAGREAWVSGTWACWGPADNPHAFDEDDVEEAEGDRSLHVVVYTDDISPGAFMDLRVALYAHDAGIFGPDPDWRLLDYAIVSDPEDWSEQTHVVTFTGNPDVVVHTLDRSVRQ